MPDKIPEQPNTVVPWWQDGSTTSDTIKEPYYLSKGVSAFFSLIKGWLLFPIQQSDPLTCSESLLDIMAWDRDITRFKNESLGLYRKRVKYAALNAKESGSVAGFKRIFERLGVGIVSFKERQSEDWDICSIELADSDLSANSALVQTLIEQYGRTCRRYRFEVSYPSILKLAGGEFSHSFSMFTASQVLGVFPATKGILGRSMLGVNVLGAQLPIPSLPDYHFSDDRKIFGQCVLGSIVLGA